MPAKLPRRHGEATACRAGYACTWLVTVSRASKASCHSSPCVIEVGREPGSEQTRVEGVVRAAAPARPAAPQAGSAARWRRDRRVIWSRGVPGSVKRGAGRATAASMVLVPHSRGAHVDIILYAVEDLDCPLDFGGHGGV